MSTPKTSLRERKKDRTRRLIRQHTLRLIDEQGYGATTVDQIADACEIAPSTFFRYFKNKDEAAKADFLDASVFEAMRVEPLTVGEGLIPLLRRVMVAVYDSMSDEEWAQERDRMRILQSVPELRDAMSDEFMRPLRLGFALLAERSGLPVDHPLVRAYAGAVIGGMASLTVPTGAEGQFSLPSDRATLLAEFDRVCDIVARIVVAPPELQRMLDAAAS